VRNGVTDEGIHALCGRLPALNYMILREVWSLTGDGLRAVGGMTTLTELYLGFSLHLVYVVPRELRARREGGSDERSLNVIILKSDHGVFYTQPVSQPAHSPVVQVSCNSNTCRSHAAGSMMLNCPPAGTPSGAATTTIWPLGACTCICCPACTPAGSVTIICTGAGAAATAGTAAAGIAVAGWAAAGIAVAGWAAAGIAVAGWAAVVVGVTVPPCFSTVRFQSAICASAFWIFFFKSFTLSLLPAASAAWSFDRCSILYCKEAAYFR
jgi:hypothetical protein